MIERVKSPLQTWPDAFQAHQQNIDHISYALKKAAQHGLEAEVMWSALTMAAEANEHGLTMEQVLEAALGEWDINGLNEDLT